MIDLHTHLLPAIDDGPRDPEATVALARELVACGVQTVAATPHVRPDHPAVVPSEIGARCRTVGDRLAEAGLTLEVVPGGEVDLLWGIEASNDDLRAVSYRSAGTDLLVETPYGPLPEGFEGMLFELSVRGFRILLAHPERNPTFQEDLGRLRALVERGTLTQVTATSLVLPPKRSRSGSLARELTREGLAHVIASDAHGAGAPGRASLAAGVEAAAALVGQARARWMVKDAPAAILAGNALPQAPARERGGLRRFRRERAWRL